MSVLGSSLSWSLCFASKLGAPCQPSIDMAGERVLWDLNLWRGRTGGRTDGLPACMIIFPFRDLTPMASKSELGKGN